MLPVTFADRVEQADRVLYRSPASGLLVPSHELPPGTLYFVFTTHCGHALEQLETCALCHGSGAPLLPVDEYTYAAGRCADANCKKCPPAGSLVRTGKCRQCYGAGRFHLHLHAVCPNGQHWDIDSRASNCTRREDNVHRCWVRHGDPTQPHTVHVDKNGDTCAAGAGSIIVNAKQPAYHGFLHNGRFSDPL